MHLGSAAAGVAPVRTRTTGLITAGLMLALPCAALLVPQGSRYARDFTRESIYGLFLAAAAGALLLRALLTGDAPALLPRMLRWPTLLLILLLLINALVAVERTVPMVDWAKRAIPFAHLLLVAPFAAILARDGSSRLVRLLQVSMIAAGVIAAGRLFNQASVQLGTGESVVENRVTMTAFENLTLPSLAVGALFSFHLVRRGRLSLRLAALAGLAANLGGIYLTQSRGLLLSALGGIAVLGVVEGIQRKTGIRRVVLTATLASLAVFVVMALHEYYGIIPERFFPESRSGAETVEGRLDEWESLLRSAEEAPIAGMGFGSVIRARFQLAPTDYSHNVFVFLFCFGGVIAVVVLGVWYLLLPFRLWRRAWRTWSGTPGGDGEIAAAFAALVCLLACAMTSTMYLTVAFNVDAAACIAMLVVTARRSEQGPQAGG